MNTLPTWFQLAGTAVVYLLGLAALYITAITALDAVVRRRADLHTPKWWWTDEQYDRWLTRRPRVRYSTCRSCGKRIEQGATQLAAWQAYVHHYETNHC